MFRALQCTLHLFFLCTMTHSEIAKNNNSNNNTDPQRERAGRGRSRLKTQARNNVVWYRMNIDAVSSAAVRKCQFWGTPLPRQHLLFCSFNGVCRVVFIPRAAALRFRACRRYRRPPPPVLSLCGVPLTFAFRCLRWCDTLHASFPSPRAFLLFFSALLSISLLSSTRISFILWSTLPFCFFFFVCLFQLL